jgi:hypothetical protein
MIPVLALFHPWAYWFLSRYGIFLKQLEDVMGAALWGAT